MLKSEEAEPIKLTYRDYKNFSFDKFKVNQENALKSCPNSYDIFEQCFSSRLDEYSPKKQSGWEGTINRTWINF